jgi:hypothetical protein
MVAVAYYLFLGLRKSAQMMQHGIGGRSPSGLAVFQDNSYTPEGQRLLGEFRKWAIRFPLVLLGAGLAIGLICNVTGW